MRAVDTNVLVRLVTRDDPSQAADAESFIANGAWVSNLVLAETTWVLHSMYGLGANALARAVDMLLNHRQLALEDPEVISAALKRFRQHPKLGFSDCLILETARKAGHLPLGTFDKSLGKIEGAQRIA
jgi:predicted nucleic-acid-binding protein